MKLIPEGDLRVSARGAGAAAAALLIVALVAIPIAVVGHYKEKADLDSKQASLQAEIDARPVPEYERFGDTECGFPHADGRLGVKSGAVSDIGICRAAHPTAAAK